MTGTLEEVSCELCGGNNNKLVGFINISERCQHIFQSGKLSIVQCNDCDLIYTNPRPSLDTLREYYNFDYEDINPKNILTKMAANKKMACCGGGYATYDPKFCGRLLNEIDQYIDNKGRRILDVGCGGGQLIKFAHDVGWNAIGQEFSHNAVKYIHDNYKVNALAGDLLDLNFPRSCFDAVTMINVIEHLTTPSKYLNEINRIIRHGGILYLTTPNTVLTNRYIERDIPEHIYHFSIESIRKILEKANFEVMRLTTRNEQDFQIFAEMLKEYLFFTNTEHDKKTLSHLFKLSLGLLNAKGISIRRLRRLDFNSGERITAIAKKL
ncbi:MAG: class I SAM-dependent methyltransferase [Methanotrichaceae archaeon]|jgi:2-polyprenyl-3-methyl-5-hydroxy-6-metoxy-1,4-benzoquinol methylase